MSDLTQQHPDSGFSIDEGIIIGLSSDSFRLRRRTGEKVHKALGKIHVNEVLQQLGENQQALYGWIEYCLRNDIQVEEGDIEKLYQDHLRDYKSRKKIASFSKGERLEVVENDLLVLSQRLNNLSILLARNPQYKRISVVIEARNAKEVSENPERVIDLLEGEAYILGTNMELQEILAWSYEEMGNYEMAFDIYEDLQCQTGELKYLEREIELLYKMGKTHEAERRYAFAEGISGPNGPKLSPKFYYRASIENLDDLKALESVLDRVFMGDSFDERFITILKSAERFIERRLEQLRKKFEKIFETTGNVFHSDNDPLHLEFLYLLEVSACILLIIPSDDSLQMRGIHRFLATLEDQYDDYRLRPAESLLNTYFLEHSQEYLDRIRKTQGEEETKDEKGEEEVSRVSAKLSGELDDVIIPSRILDILDFLYVRTSGATKAHQSIQATIAQFHNKIARDFPDVDTLDDAGFSSDGERVFYRLKFLDAPQRVMYERLKKYSEKKYGKTISELIVFYSLDVEKFSEFELKAIKSDPRLLLFSLTTTLLGDVFIPQERLSSFVLDPILEALTPAESYFLCSLLFQEGRYHVLAEFLLDDAYLLSDPKFFELFLLSLSYMENGAALTFIDECDSETLPDRYETRDIPEFLEKLEEDSQRKPIDQLRLVHARFLLSKIQEEEIEFHQISLTPIPDGTVINDTEASHFFSIFRSLPIPKTPLERIERIRYLESLYPYLKLEKRQALESIFALAGEEGRVDIIRKNIAIAENEEITLGLWRYYPGLLGGRDEYSLTLESLSENPYLEYMPGEMTYRIYRNSSDALSPLHQLQRNFILVFANAHIEESLDALRVYFESLAQVLAPIMVEHSNLSFDQKYHVLLQVLRPEGFSTENPKPHHIESKKEFLERFVLLLIGHMDRLRASVFQRLLRHFESQEEFEASKEKYLEKWEESFRPFIELLRNLDQNGIYSHKISELFQRDIRALSKGELMEEFELEEPSSEGPLSPILEPEQPIIFH